MRSDAMRNELAAFIETRGLAAKGTRGRVALFEGQEARWQIALCPDQAREMEFLKTFEAAMERLITIRQAGDSGSGDQLALAVSFGPVLAGERTSYRRALKKYTSSIVFEDVGIALLLVSEGGVEMVAPEGVNEFLRGLDGRIRAARRS